jgi:alpha-glucosidase (family GH31 glycosyl hydrolase)
MKASINQIFVFVLLTASLTVSSQSTNNKLPKRTVADTNLILPPSWAFGILYGGYTSQQETMDRIEEIKKHNYPIDAYWIDSWFWSCKDKGKGPVKYIDFVADTINYPNRKAMWDFMTINNIKGGFWTWNCILKTGNESAFEDFKIKNLFSNIYFEKNTWHNSSINMGMSQYNIEHPGTECGNINFDDPQAADYFKFKMKHFFDEGADFIKLDRTAEISVCRAMFAMSQQFGKETKGRGFVLSHSFGTEDEEYKRYPAKWTDDTRSDWTIEKPLVKFAEWSPAVALKENITMFTYDSKPSSKIPFLANDLGGYTVGNVKMPEEELYIRWMQFSMFNPIVEVFSEPENITSNLPWLYSERADSIFRFYSHLRMQLFPYIYSYALRSRIEGKHMLGKFPEHIYQYTFGDELLAAPVYEKGATTQKVFLPEEKWINFWTGEQLQGNAEYTVAAPLDQIPLFVKQGSIIPMRNYASSVETGNNNELTLHLYPGANGSFNLLEDDGISNDYLYDKYVSTHIEWKENKGIQKLIINPALGKYFGMREKRIWKICIHSIESPKKILLNNKKINFTNDKENRLTLLNSDNLPVKKRISLTIYL